MTSLHETWIGPLKQVGAYEWHLPKDSSWGMYTNGIVFGDQAIIQAAVTDKAWEQVRNITTLPGIVGSAMAMPDIHWGYGFPIGGVAAFDAKEGIISPGGVGYDINCGVRLLRSNLTKSELLPHITTLLTSLYQNIPAGLGSESRFKLSKQDLQQILIKGSTWAVNHDMGWDSDIDHTESQGCLASNTWEHVGEHALDRGKTQLGSLGSGNHFLEIQMVDKIYDKQAAAIFGLDLNQITVMIHCGSRGLGHQVCDDFAHHLKQQQTHYGFELPDPQLACAPIQSQDGQAYLSAMACAANYAWTNRQIISHQVRNSFEQVFQLPSTSLGLRLVYDVAHNIAKFEKHMIAGKEKTVCVHRKGATRAFPANHPEIPKAYQAVGQPVLIPGSMGTASYVCVGTQEAMTKTFGSTSHGAGRSLSRHAALRRLKGRMIAKELKSQGIAVMAHDRKTLIEEAPEVYKDIDQVINAIEGAGLSKKVARLVPLAVVKG